MAGSFETRLHGNVSTGISRHTASARSLYAAHLQTLQERFECYFPDVADIEDCDWIRDLFSQESSTAKLTLKEREESAELRMDRTMKLKFSELPLDQFWLASASAYPNISLHATEKLLLFSTTYLCELAFSTLDYMKSNRRSRLYSIPPRIKMICTCVSLVYKWAQVIEKKKVKMQSKILTTISCSAKC